MSILKKLFCKHEYKTGTLSTVKCKKCDRIKHDPVMAWNLIGDDCDKMVERGIWNKDTVKNNLIRHGMNRA